MEHEYDVLIIGGGVVGCAIARELAAYRLKIGVLEKNPDVGYETSARNTGVVHGGFAYDVGSLKAALCVEGNRMMGELAEELHFPFKRCGKILVGSTEEEYARLLEVIRQGEACGASNLRMVDREELHAILPSVEGNFALLSENSGIVDPFHFIQEITDPRRTLTSSVLVTDGELPLCSVRLTDPVPITRISDVMKEIRKMKVEAPLESGTVLIRDVLGLGSDVITTKTIRRITAAQ